MASHLSADQIVSIVSLIDTWPEETRITWEALRTRVGNRLGIWPSRQTLYRHEQISIALKTRKAALRKDRGVVPAGRGVGQLERRLKAELARVERENENYRELVARLQYNAYKHGMTKRELHQPMPQVDRGRTA